MTIITGHYGSGKTTFALNLALKRAGESGSATLVDLDIVNPYFRSADHEKLLADHNITLVSTAYANTNLDLPSLTAGIYGAFEKPGEVIVDVGGDDSGATALGRFSGLAEKRGYEMLCVINARRNLTSSPEDAAEMLHDIEAASSLKANGLVNNTHLKALTTPEVIYMSLPYAQKVSELTGLPVVYTTVPRSLAGGMKDIDNLYPVEPYVMTPWELFKDRERRH